MASPGDLVRTTAEALGVPEATVVVHDRNLVIAGLRTKSGRGRSAARTTARDAAHLLTAMAGSGLVKDSVATVRRYANTQLDSERSSIGGYASLKLAELTALPRDHSFLDALEALIVSTAKGGLRSYMEETGQVPQLEIGVLNPRTAGDIRVAALRGKTASCRYAPPHPARKAKMSLPARREWETELKKQLTAGGLEFYGRITTPAILRVAELLTP